MLAGEAPAGPPDDAVPTESALPFLAAWEMLRHDRQYSPNGVPLTIPFSAIDRWATRHRVDDTEFDLFRRMILALDDVYCAWARREVEKNMKKR